MTLEQVATISVPVGSRTWRLIDNASELYRWLREARERIAGDDLEDVAEPIDALLARIDAAVRP